MFVKLINRLDKKKKDKIETNWSVCWK